MFKKVHLSITALLFASAAFAQSGAIKVHMFDKATKQPIPFANVVVEKGGTQISGGVTDLDGYVTIKPLDPGQYDVKAVYEGYQEKEFTGISVAPDKTNYLEMDMASTMQQIKQVDIVQYKTPLIAPNTQTGQTVTREDYQHMAVKDVNSVAATTAGVYQSDVGGDINVRGSRSNATQFIIDGVKITADQNIGGIPQSMIDEETVITGGVPANYGDATGGIIVINTMNPSPKFFGSAEAITSEVLDPFGYNDFNFSIGGPIYSKKDTATHTKVPVIDFILGGEVSYKQDNNPSFVGAYTANSDTLSKVQQTPFLLNPQGGFYRASEFIDASEITHTAAHINDPSESVSVNGKLGFQVNSNVRVTVGGSFEYSHLYQFDFNNMLLNNTENPLQLTTAYRTFVRLTQRFPTPEGKDAKQSIIKNAYYSIQASYGNTFNTLENPYFKGNIFDYSFVGQFQQYYSNQYQLKNGRYGLANYQTAYSDSLYSFKPGTENPLLANYTSEIYQLLGANNITNPNTVEQAGGLLNGDNPAFVYSLWHNTGFTGAQSQAGISAQYQLGYNSHFDFTANFSADIKNHAVQVGFEYEQNVISYFDVNTPDLWVIMRQDANKQLQQLDTNNPILITQGTTNTYGYNRLYDGVLQTQFDKSLRQKLGLAENSTTFIQPDQYAPSMYSLSMFSASDLLNNGSNAVIYAGYNYNGTLSNANVSIDDFFNKVDANGNNTYPVAPYHPIYIAGFIQDHFDIKNLKFDVGIRVEDFNANQPVLKDPYLMYPAKTVAEVQGSGLGTIPSNMGSNYVVYVNNSESPTAIVGYRNGNDWYNASGNLVSDPSVIAASTVTGGIQPYLENPSQTQISSNVFTNYTPQVNVLPRIAFSFPISDVANFFAHYDVLSQRPPGVGFNISNPLDYLEIQSRGSQVLENPNLLPEETTDYELGFTQVLNEQKSSALTISAFYRDMKNLLETYRFYDAYPVTYLAFNNIDFGTVKGLSVTYDLRRVNNLKLRASYTLQFANGTGSGPYSGYNLASSNEPNLQIPQALSFDQRHTILVNIDYHYGADKNYNGPVWTTKGGKSIQILANAGFNMNITAGSGTPYTAQGNITEGNPNTQNVALQVAQRGTLVGTINGAYLPWQFRVDLQVDKDFPLVLQKSKGDKAKHCDLLVFLRATNLLNTENIQQVYAFTGSPSDDGFLASIQGQQTTATQTSPQAFQDQYKIKEQDPTYLSLPRQLRLGVDFNF